MSAPSRASLIRSVNRGGRFSTNAAIASSMSPVKLDRIWVRFSRSMPAWRLPISSWLHMTSFVMRTPNGLLPTISSAVSSARVDDRAVGHDRGDEPDAVGFGRVDQPTGQQQLERAGRADEAGQHPRHADVAARQADADERDVEAGTGRRDADVARQREREPATRRRAVHRGDDRLRHRSHLRDEARDQLLHRHARPGRGPSPRRRRARALGQVETRAEPATRAGEHDHAAGADRPRQSSSASYSPATSSWFIALSRSGRFSVTGGCRAAPVSAVTARVTTRLLVSAPASSARVAQSR